MKILKNVIVAVVCVLFASAVAEAAELVTPSVLAAPGETIMCSIVNLTNQEQFYIIEQIAPDGSVASIDDDHTVAAGGSRFFGVVNNDPGIRQRYCKIIVQGVIKGKLRGAIFNESTGIGFPAE
jgi:hypothetical protein